MTIESCWIQHKDIQSFRRCVICNNNVDINDLIDICLDFEHVEICNDCLDSISICDCCGSKVSINLNKGYYICSECGNYKEL